MKNAVAISSLFFLLSACKEENNTPTIFKGQVVYEDNNEVITKGHLMIESYEYKFLFDKPISRDSITISDKGKFDVNLNYHPDIDYYTIYYYYNDAGRTVIPELDCSAISSKGDCYTLLPGKSYEFDLKVVR